ncbi:hypothetical protein C5167_032995 [Papaver somniferum]|uniref:Uncharacterized protein n=1 Tax=Papaver somniferum TaxID=3469 RepID=A0A4Y7KCU8_PAPSO|nr:hypothetical protein C5167_032995 [Papaver somniferum]
MEQGCLGVAPEEQRSDKLFGLEDATPKGKNRRGHGASKSSSVPCTGNRLENDATPKKKYRRNRGEDGDVKIKNKEQHDPTDDD